jgi:hypothetical protein
MRNYKYIRKYILETRTQFSHDTQDQCIGTMCCSEGALDHFKFKNSILRKREQLLKWKLFFVLLNIVHLEKLKIIYYI